MEAELHCSNAIQIMERKLRAACHASDANIDNVGKVLDGLLSDYEAASHGPAKWQKLTMFLQKRFNEELRIVVGIWALDDVVLI
ncbi:hypothetical protein ACFX11_038829 [Malus domestica]